MIISLLLTQLALAGDAVHHLGAAAGGTWSGGPRTHVAFPGADLAFVYRRQGPRHGLQLELRDFAGFTRVGVANLPGLNVSWSALWREEGPRPCSNLGLGAHLNDVVIALPMLTAEGGVQLGGDGGWLRVGLQGFYVPPTFAIGGGLRVSGGVQLRKKGVSS